MSNFSIKLTVFGSKDYSNDGVTRSSLNVYAKENQSFQVSRDIVHGEDPSHDVPKVLTVVYLVHGDLLLLYGIDGATVQFDLS
jgi:hypothetical protein